MLSFYGEGSQGANGALLALHRRQLIVDNETRRRKAAALRPSACEMGVYAASAAALVVSIFQVSGKIALLDLLIKVCGGAGLGIAGAGAQVVSSLVFGGSAGLIVGGMYRCIPEIAECGENRCQA